MGSIKSDIGERPFDSPEMKRFSVDDPTQSPIHDPRSSQQPLTADEIMALRQQKVNEMNRVGDVARRRIESLVGIGRAHLDIPIKEASGDTVTFSVRTLKGKEIKHLVQVTSEAEKSNSIVGLYNIRTTALAYALYAIDGTNVDAVLDCQGMDEDAKFAAREVFLEELDESVLNHIYTRYEDLTKENRGRYAIATPEEAKEVVEDIKKSS